MPKYYLGTNHLKQLREQVREQTALITMAGYLGTRMSVNPEVLTKNQPKLAV